MKRVVEAIARRVIPRLVPVVRLIGGLRRPSKATSMRRLQQRGETLESIAIREATAADIPALARLHVTTFNETHTSFGAGGPTFEAREWQYRQKFAQTDGNWFCFVAARADGELVGFAVAAPSDDAEYRGQLNKLYLLRAYQRLGLGTRLVGHVVHRFLEQGITSMLLFSQADNPSIFFFDAMRGERWLTDKGEFHGGYRWNDLARVAREIGVPGAGYRVQSPHR